MDIFYHFGDLCYLLAPSILLFKLMKTRSCEGLSGLSQLLYAIVFTTRYYTLLLCDCEQLTPYAYARRVVYIAASYGIVYLIYVRFKATLDSRDKFRLEFLIVPAVALALLIHGKNAKWEILWSFSIYLESVAILPQLFIIIRTGEAERIIYLYLTAIASARPLYIAPYLIGTYSIDGRHAIIYVVCGIVQTLIYLVFFCYKMFVRYKQPQQESGFVPHCDGE